MLLLPVCVHTHDSHLQLPAFSAAMRMSFKSIKSIEKITFLADDGYASRRTFWSEVNSNEYGFFANVNPEVPHRRWSQATERHYVEGYPGARLDTTRMNGYQAQVDYLYENIEDTAIYF